MNFELPKNPDGSLNKKYVDLLDEDNPIAGQKFACMSFISPENILKDKNIYMFEKFLKIWDFKKSKDKFTQFLYFLSTKHSLNFDDLVKDFEEFCEEEKDLLKKTNIEDDYKTFLDTNESQLQEQFNKEHDFQTSVRALKVRGVYNSQEEAEIRCKLLREQDPNHNILVGPVGMWMPWDPDAYKTGRVEYLEPELNKLMSEKMKNDTKLREEFLNRVEDTKKDAIKENIKKAKESGNKLTQNINEDGTLNSLNTASLDELKNELFNANQDSSREEFNNSSLNAS